MDGYNPEDFRSVMEYTRREFGAEIFRNPARMFSTLCDLSPKLKPYANVTRRLAERGILSGLENAVRDGNALEQARMLMKARDILENELLLGADRVEYFLTLFGNLCGAEAFATRTDAPQTAAQSQPVPQPQAVPQPKVLPTSGKSGGLTWTLDSAGQLTISGRGPMDDFTAQGYHQSSAPWSAHRCAIFSALIKGGVTRIGQEAFSYCASLKSVLIPAGVTQIGYMAFRGCTALRRVTVPDSVREIGVSAFEGCAGLRGVKLSRGLERIETRAFADCRSLTSITLPNSVRRVGYRAFRDCPNLSAAYVPAGAETDPDAFDFHTAVTRW